MSRIQDAFQNKKAFIPFITAGDPTLAKTKEYILQMAAAGADLIEIGLPFSDPIAEGPVIQEADIRALASGTTTDKVLEMVAELKGEITIPLVFMTYLNPVFHYGYETFFARCQEVGVCGIIIPDLPYEEKEEVLEVADKYQVELVSMVAPTSAKRIREIAVSAKGFLYVVSSLGVTGVRSEIKTDIERIIKEIRQVTDLPCAVGFGINTPEQAARIARHADGVIVGSGIVDLIAKYGDTAGEAVYQYVKEMKEAIIRL